MSTAKISFLSLIATASAVSQTPFGVDPGFNISSVATVAQALPSHSWLVMAFKRR
jgi:hypothetical protein